MPHAEMGEQANRGDQSGESSDRFEVPSGDYELVAELVAKASKSASGTKAAEMTTEAIVGCAKTAAAAAATAPAKGAATEALRELMKSNNLQKGGIQFQASL